MAPRARDTVTFTLDAEDLVRFQTVCARYNGPLRYRLLFCLLLGVPTAALLCLIAFLPQFAFHGDLLLLIFLVALFLLYFCNSMFFLPVLLRTRGVAVYNSSPEYAAPCTLEIYNEVLRVRRLYSQETLDWKDVTCLETATHFCFLTHGEPGSILPKSELTQQQSEEFSRFLSGMLDDRYCRV